MENQSAAPIIDAPLALALTPNYFDVRSYANIMGGLNIWEGDGYLEESMSWKESCYIHAGLSVPCTHITGRDAEEFLSRASINDVRKWPLHKGKHLVMCTDEGIVAFHALTIRDDDNVYRTWNSPVWLFALKQRFAELEVDIELTMNFIFQIAGPKSREAIEKVLGESIGDVAFLMSKKIRIPGRDEDFEIVRIGMTGNLAYEIRGPIEVSADIYDIFYKAGLPLGMKRLGWATYPVNHTEGGYPQENLSFVTPLNDFTYYTGSVPGHTGSYDPEDARARWRTPHEVGWSWMARFNHDFVGRAAVEAEVASPKRTIVTLEWNPDDVLDINRSYLEAGEPYKQLTLPTAPQPLCGGHADRVLKDGEVVGVSSMVAYSYYYRTFISHCTIDVDQAEIGNEVVVEWGDYGKRIKQIRAKVARYPYLELPRNNEV